MKRYASRKITKIVAGTHAHIQTLILIDQKQDTPDLQYQGAKKLQIQNMYKFIQVMQCMFS